MPCADARVPAMLDRPPPRTRGRPQVRSDDETRKLVLQAAERAFAEQGYTEATTDAVAKIACVSKKTVYRLFPGKADLFAAIMKDRQENFTLALDNDTDDVPLDQALTGILMQFVQLVVTRPAITQSRLSFSQVQRFPEMASTFYHMGRKRSTDHLAVWLRRQCDRGRMKLDDPTTAASFLLSMVADEPMRIVGLGIADIPPPEALAERVRQCVAIFLNGTRP